MEPLTAIKGQLFDLKQRFVQRVPDRIAAIASTLPGCNDGGRDAMDLLERQFHALAGTAGTYDHNAVSAAAFEGEEACADLDKSPLDSDSFKHLTFLVDQLRSALADDAPAPWSVRTVLTAADAPDVASGKTGGSCA